MAPQSQALPLPQICLLLSTGWVLCLEATLFPELSHPQSALGASSSRPARDLASCPPLTTTPIPSPLCPAYSPSRIDLDYGSAAEGPCVLWRPLVRGEDV
ncbi:hypothetical protein AAFF_G00210170 [Aldrovandia affinis]|uniref:Uncharacterized protein n=1 Tax=Aldrovandia affinis TaxID=143900 RepID=A0AAD7WUH6_9TELE|nr:hypothetical protein AAFF_G00210170 [Aldrovandia affinis]